MKRKEISAADAAVLARLPALRDYLDRIGARAVSLKKFVIDDPDGKRPLATVKIRDDKIACDNDEYAPTDQEKALIVAELAVETARPKSIPATEANVRDFCAKLDKDETVFIFRSAAGGTVEMIEQRKVVDGKKMPLPWTFWSDAVWRCAEPDGKLPLYGLDRIDTGRRVMIHEGAKGAEEVRKLVADPEALAKHPWGQELRQYEHIGWPGGTERVRQVDWKPLLAATHVTFVADNDAVGKNAIPIISKILGRRMDVLCFDKRFPAAFDLADPFPEKLWVKGRYRGPTLGECLRPATWATEIIPGDKVGRPSYAIRREFAAEWYVTVKPAKFIHRENPNYQFDEGEFNSRTAPFSDVKDVAGLLRHASFDSHALTISYVPGQPYGDIGDAINVFFPSAIKPAEGYKPTDAKPWLDFMALLVPGERDRERLLKWCATLIARPDIRMRYGVLLISEAQGVGKGTLGEKILAKLVGMHNASFPSAQAMTQSDFNSWRVRKRLAVLHELYDGESSKGYDRAKSAITDDTNDVNEKYEKSYTILNWIHVLACSNSRRALKMSDTDRRWFIPKVAEKKQPPLYWKGLNEWLVSGGLEIIAAWAAAYVAEHGPVETHDEAPYSEAKQETIEAARSIGEELIAELGHSLGEHAPLNCVRLDKIRNWLATMKSADPTFGNEGGRFLETADTIARVLRSIGLHTSRQFKEKAERFRVVSAVKIGNDAKWDEIEEFELEPAAVYALEELSA